MTQRRDLRSFITGLLLLVVVLVGTPHAQPPSGDGSAGTVSLRVMTYNIHHGEGLDGRIDLQRIAAVIAAEKADVVFLQEVDRGVQRSRRLDISRELATLTDMRSVFGKNIDFEGGDYGNAILSRFPIRSERNVHYRMLRKGEQRGLLLAEVEIGGQAVLLMNTHIDYREDDTERLMNVEEALDIAQGWTAGPILFAGDFNDTPDSRVHQRLEDVFDDVWPLVGQGDGFSFSAERPHKRIDVLWVRGTDRLVPLRVRVASTDASDHLPVVAELELQPLRNGR